MKENGKRDGNGRSAIGRRKNVQNLSAETARMKRKSLLIVIVSVNGKRIRKDFVHRNKRFIQVKKRRRAVRVHLRPLQQMVGNDLMKCALH